jgi:hypothetical protein
LEVEEGGLKLLGSNRRVMVHGDDSGVVSERSCDGVGRGREVGRV